jgi:hypothetical protein
MSRYKDQGLLWRFVMGSVRKNLSVAIFAGLVFGLLSSCENPFDKGLGDKVNITPPVIQITSPAPGSYIQDITRMEGTAADDRGVTRIEIGVFNTIEDDGPETWSSEGFEYDGANWSYNFDTSLWNNGRDGTIKLQFRAFDDGDEPVATAPLVYVIKNSLPELTLTTPAPGRVTLVTGTTIRGQVRDRRGIRPGYPKIKFWAANVAEPGEEGWVSVEIPGKELNDLEHLGSALRTSEFVYTLNERDPLAPQDGQHYYTSTPLGLGGYKFRFKTRDYVTETGEGGLVDRPDLEKERFDPPEGEDPYSITLTSATESVRFELAPPESLPEEPQKYITSAASYKKAAPANPRVELFTLRVRVSHTYGIDVTTRPPQLAWHHDTGTSTPQDITAKLSRSEVTPGDPRSSWILEYTAWSDEIALPSHSAPYIFTFSVWSGDGNVDPTKKEYAVYMAGTEGIEINIVSVTGASAEPAANADYYTVNQTFKTALSYSGGDSGIRTVSRTVGSEQKQQPVLRWRLVEDNSAEHTALETYFTAPPRYNTAAGVDAVGAILPAATAEAEYIDGNSFTVNTSGKSGTWWLYILAQDQAYNVQCLKQEIKIDQGADYPAITINRDFRLYSQKNSDSTNWPPVKFAGVEGHAQFADWKTNNILRQGQTFDITLNDDDGLDLSALKLFISDELAFSAVQDGGIDGDGNPVHSPEGTYARSPVPAATIRAIFPGADSAVVRQSAGTITQAHIAAALGKQTLPDGVYRFDMEVKDKSADKVNTAEDVRTTLYSFWFYVSAEEEGMIFPDGLISPQDGGFVTAAPVEVTGTVKSRLKVEAMTGTPPGTSTATSFAKGTDFDLDAASPQPPAAAADGYYTYTWKHPGTVDFDPGTLSGNSRTYTLTATDRFGSRVLEKNLNLVLDNTPPVISLMPFETLTGSKVNGLIEFTFTVEEANGVKEIRWWLSETAAPPAWDTGFDPDGSPVAAAGYFETGAIKEGESYTVRVDTSSQETATAYYLYAAALDQAGNRSVFSSPGWLEDMVIDQSSDTPEVTSLNPPDETAVRSWDAGIHITGTATDDDGFSSKIGTGGGAIDTDKKFVEIRFPAAYDTTTGAAASWNDDDWISVPGTIDAEGARGISFDFDLGAYHTAYPGAAYFNFDGRKEFQIRVMDDKNRKGIAEAAALWSVERLGYFILDNNPPDYTLPVTGVFKTAADAEAALSGTLTEMNLQEPNGFDYNFYGDWKPVEPAVTAVPGEYTWAIPADALTAVFNSRSDGELIVQFRARDKAGSEITKDWLFYKDTQGPEASFSTINRARTGTVPAPADFPANWPLDWPAGSAWTSDAAWSTSWKTTIADWPSEYAFMEKQAVIDSLAADTAAALTVVSGTEPQILGNFWDRYSAVRDNASDTVYFEYRFNSSGRGDSAAWTQKALTGGDADTSAPNAGQSTVFWAVPLSDTSLLPSDGENTFDIRVQDKRGNETALYGLRFKVDRTDPVVAVSEPAVFTGNPAHIIGINSDTGAVATLSGSADDALLTKVTVRLTQSASDDTVIREQPFTASGSSLNWSFDITAADILSLADDDNQQQRIIVIAEDEAGRQKVENWYFYRDTKSPVISYSNLGKGADGLASGNAFGDGSLILKGTVEDANGVKAIKYYIAKYDYSAKKWMNWDAGSGSWKAEDMFAEPVPAAWANMPLEAGGSLGQKMVRWELDLSTDSRFYTSGTGVEGQYRIKIYAEDYSYHNSTPGNPIVTSNADPAYSDAGFVAGDPANPPSPRIFFIDNSAPSLACTVDEYYRSGPINALPKAVKFTGTASDSNGIRRIRAKFNDVDFNTSLVELGAADVAAGAWELVMPLDSADGIYTLNIEVTDAAGKVNYFNKDFTLDNTPPTVVVNQPQANNAIVAGEVNVRGTGEDNFSLNEVRYYLGPTAPDPVADPANWNNWKDGAWTVTNGTTITLAEIDGGVLVWNLSMADSTNFSLNWTDILSLVTADTTTGSEGDFKGAPVPAGKTVYRLPVHIGAQDKAGNFTEYDADPGTPGIQPLTLLVYPEGDKPTITISNPNPDSVEADRLVGGEVRVFGEALDNAWVKEVYFRVLDTNNSPVTTLTVPNWNADGSQASGNQTAGTLAIDYTGSSNSANQNGWYRASGVESSRMNWYVNINGDSALDPANPGDRRPVTIEVVAFDAFRNGDGAWGGGAQRIAGPIAKVSAVFVKDAPKFSGERVFAGKSSGWDEDDAVSINEGAMLGKASYKVIVRDEGGINSLRWRKTTTGAWSELPTDKASYESGLDAALADPGNRGIVARAEPRNVIAAAAMTADTWYMVMETGNTSWTALSTPETSLPTDADYAKYTTFKTKSPISPAGTGKVIKAVQIDGSAITADTQFRYYEWEITVDLDTETLKYFDQAANAWLGYPGKARNHFIYLQAQDITKPNASITNRTVALPIDYFYPQGIYTGNANAAGANYSVQGTATDNGSGVQVQGIRKVVLWFNKGMVITGNTVTAAGTNYKFGSGGTFAMPATQPFTAALGRIAEDVPDVTAAANLLSYYLPPDDGDSSIVIDKDDPLGASGHHIPMGFSGTGDGKEWYAEIDTTNLPSGPITLNYVVFDFAGNASFYQQRLIIKNGAPQIKTVTLGTDLLGTQSGVTGWAALDDGGKAKAITIRSGVGNTYTPKVDAADTVDFMARNSLLFFNVEMVSGTTATRTFSLDYVSGTAAKEADDLEQGKIYRITDVGTGTNWEAVGAPAGYKAGSVFLAAVSGTPYGTGKAELLNTVSALRKTWAGASGNSGRAFYFPAADFGTAAGKISDGTASFILKVFDGAEADDFADIALINNIKVQNADTGPADGRLYDLNPLTMESTGTVPTDFTPPGIGENRAAPGLWYTKTDGLPASRSGHIEPRKTTTLTSAEMGGAATSALSTVSKPYADPAAFFTVDTVSGKVILRGYAENDQRLGNISLTIGGTEFNILEKTSSVSPDDGKTGLLAAAANANASGKVFFTDVIDLVSHRVEWAYLWDTETLPAAAVGSVALKTTVKNNAGSNNTDRSQAAAGNNANYTSITVNAAPYITGLSRASTYNSARSAQGWYAFSREETITVTGFNLKHNTGTTTVSLPGAASITVTHDSTTPKNKLTFTVPAAAGSGALGLTANGVKAVNTSTGTGFRPAVHYVNPWNKESSALEGSDLWEDFTSAHVWQSNNTGGNNLSNVGYFAKGESAALLYDPGMTINPANGQLHGIYSISWQSGADSSRVYTAVNADINSGTSTDYGLKMLLGFCDPVLEGDIQYTDNDVYAAFNVKGRYQNDQYWNSIGGIYLDGAGGTDSGLYYAANDDNQYLVEKAFYSNRTDQFASPHLAVYKEAAATQYDLHAAYYDVNDKSIKYRYHQGGSPGDIAATAYTNGASDTIKNNTGIRRWINLDGAYDTEDTTGYGAANSRVAGHATPQPARTSNAGFHNAIDVTSNGHPVIAYFDETNQTLRLAYCSNTGNTYTASTWTVMEVFNSADPNRLETGSYVTMRIDRASGGNNKIHIAAYNTANSALVYVAGTWNAAATDAPSFGDSQVVDTSAGSRADLSLDDAGNPWITYVDNNEGEGYGKLKLAYLDPVFTRDYTDINGRSLRGWETMNIPIRYEAKDDRLSLENFPVRGTSAGSTQFWNAAVGYLSKDQLNFRIAYRVK